MDAAGGFEDLELREAQREYLDFLDDDVWTNNVTIYNETSQIKAFSRCSLSVATYGLGNMG